MLNLATDAAAPAAVSVMDAIYERRSVRSYLPGTVDRKLIGVLLDAAVQAPTAAEEAPWAFVVIPAREALKRLSDKALQMRRLEAGAGDFGLAESVFYGAGTLIVICGKPLGPFVAGDCWLAAENLMLAARALGLGTCVISPATAALNTPEWKAELNVPAGVTAYVPIVVGAPSGEAPAAGRREAEVLAWKTGLSV